MGWKPRAGWLRRSLHHPQGRMLLMRIRRKPSCRVKIARPREPVLQLLNLSQFTEKHMHSHLQRKHTFMDVPLWGTWSLLLSPSSVV